MRVRVLPEPYVDVRPRQSAFLDFALDPTWPVLLQFPLASTTTGGGAAAGGESDDAPPPPRPSKRTLQLDQGGGGEAPPQWLHGKMGNQKAASLLVGGPDGTFLVRERATSSEYALSVVFRGKPTHHMLKHDAETGRWVVNKASTGGTDLESAVAGLSAVTKSWPVALEHPVPVNPNGGTPPTGWAQRHAAGIDL